jgi:hypothetical protein
MKASPSLMSTWQGFDERKICPQCGDYQTRVASKQRQSFSSPRLLFSLMRYIGVALVPILALFILSFRPLNVYLLGFFFLGFVGVVIFLAYRTIYSGEGEKMARQSQEQSLIGYRLYCHNCGYTWEMTTEEWETAGRKERENFINFPSRLPSNASNLDDTFERIEWKPPHPSKGILIVMGFIGLSLIVSLLLYGVFWAKAHRGNPYAIVVNGIGAIVALFISMGLIVVIKPKANKAVLMILILVTLIGLALASLTFLVE